MNDITTPNTQSLAERVQLARRKVAEYKHGYMTGALAYDDLAQAGKELSAALFEYSKAKFPNAKARRLPYQAVIR